MFGITESPSNRSANISLRNLGKSSKHGIRQGFYKVGAMATREINTATLEKPRLGRVYKHEGKKHRASRAGESFANRSGAARKTRGFDVNGSSRLEFGFRKNGETIYTKLLENSTGDRHRPTVGNAHDKIKGRVQGIMQAELAKAHKDGYK